MIVTNSSAETGECQPLARYASAIIQAPMKPILPLRDRKKAKLRQALADASLRLFLHKGYSATTLEEISAECDVTVQTLLRYFGSKEDLLFARQAEIVENCERGLIQAAANKDVISYWLHFFVTSAHTVV